MASMGIGASASTGTNAKPITGNICLRCKSDATRVTNTSHIKHGTHRRRLCIDCNFKWSTIEVYENKISAMIDARVYEKTKLALRTLKRRLQDAIEFIELLNDNTDAYREIALGKNDDIAAVNDRTHGGDSRTSEAAD